MPIPRLKLEQTVLLVVDFQERLLPQIDGGESVVASAAKLIAGCAALKLPIIVTEQNPQKLGPTVGAIAEALPRGTPIEAKMKFSAWIEPVRKHVSELNRWTVLICGIETHVCVMQTALDLAAAGYVAAVATDAIGSRRVGDHQAGLARMNTAHVLPVSVEMALLEMVHEAGTDRFRSVLPIVR
ncbi:MAG: isochorismatase family protein [Planctomycetes bacterium]|nr:isochorismatase family protein [Planctomycetota bacterium]